MVYSVLDGIIFRDEVYESEKRCELSASTIGGIDLLIMHNTDAAYHFINANLPSLFQLFAPLLSILHDLAYLVHHALAHPTHGLQACHLVSYRGLSALEISTDGFELCCLRVQVRQEERQACG